MISALGGSRVQIGGPTGAFVVIVYGIVQKYGVDGLLVATLMAGSAPDRARAWPGLGGAIKFIPFPVVTGFTAAIARDHRRSSSCATCWGCGMRAAPAGA